MTTRLLALLPVFAAILAFSGCAGPDEPAQTPEPRAKGEKPKAELLIGKWKLVKRTPPPSPFVPMTFEYTKDGKVRLFKGIPMEFDIEIQTGTYRVEGSTLFRSMDTEPTERNVTIESITEEKLVTSGFSGNTRMVQEYERLRDDWGPRVRKE